MSLLGAFVGGHNDTGEHVPRWQDQIKEDNQRDTKVQAIVSIVFGLSAFLSFCV